MVANAQSISDAPVIGRAPSVPSEYGQRDGDNARPNPGPDPRLALAPSPNGRRWGRRLLFIGVWGLIALSLLGVTAWTVVGSMTASAPAWWRHTDAGDAHTIDRALILENAIASHLSLRRDSASDLMYTGAADLPELYRSDPWSVALKSEDANAWLNVRLPVWLAGENESFVWPEEVSDLQVQFDAPHVRLGAKIKVRGKDQFLSATLTPELREDGSLWVKADWVHLGRLPIPASLVLGEAEARMDEIIPDELRSLPQAQSFFRVMAGEEPVAERPVVKLPDRRLVRLLRLEADKGWVEITCQTELRSRGGSPTISPSP